MSEALGPYRVVDLTTERGWYCGKMLADLGADVVKVEPPGGDPGRHRGPFHGDAHDPERNLRWWFRNRGKRSVVLDLDDEAGRDDLRALVATADAVIESFDPGWLAGRGLGPDDLLAVNPALVVTSVTPFGQDGPYASFAGPDLVLSAMSGPMWLTGDPDRPPVRISVPQYELHGSAEAAVHTMAALQHAARFGVGQHVDVSCQLAGIRTLMNASSFPHVTGGPDLVRQGASPGYATNRLRQVYRVKDGHVSVLLGRAVGPLMQWIAAEEGLPEPLRAIDWDEIDFGQVVLDPDQGALVAQVADVVEAFFAVRTKAELYDAALARLFLLAPINTVADIRVDEQLTAREYFRPVDHGDLGQVHYAGPWVRMSATPLVETRRAPAVGEHTEEVLAEARAGRRPPARPRLAPPAPVADAPSEPFAGLKVWDMSWVGVGPLTSRYLADYGATVIRLDSSKRPDVLRMAGPFRNGEPGLNNSHFYGDYNTSKLGMGLDLANPLGKEVAMRLVEWADVVTESFTPKTMAAWGMGYDQLREVNPRVVMYSTCMQGQTGPRRNYRGFGQLMAALSGFYEITGWPDRDPSPVYGAYTDFVCQRFGATALIAAIDHQRRTGEGQHIDLSQFEAALQFLGPELLDLEVNGRVATRAGNTDPFAAPHGVYPCRPGERGERWIAIAVRSDQEWGALVERMGSPAWATDARFSTAAGRKAAEAELDERLAEWTAGHDADELFLHLQPAVAAGPVHDQTALHEDRQIVHRGYYVTLEHTVQGLIPYDGMQATLSATPGRLSKAAPCVGEDTYDILADVLGYSEDEIADLIATEAVEITGA